jgi:hypothetical protein
MATVAVGLALLVLAAALGWVGRLGWVHAADLSATIGGGRPDGRRRQAVRRGAGACMAVAALLAVGAVTGLVGAVR